MAITGQLPLSKFQAAIESVYATALPATRLQPMVGGLLTEHIERQMVKEQRGSFIAHYRSYAYKRWSELTGMSVAPTFEDLPWFLQAFAKGSVTGTGGGTPRTYTFTPTTTSDDLNTVCWEVGDNTQAFQIAGCVGQTFEISIGAQSATTMSVGYIGNQAVNIGYTSSLSDRVTEDIIGALATAYIDTTTIGSTNLDVLDAKVTIPTQYQQLFALSGSLGPTNVYRGDSRAATIEATLAFDSTAARNEYLNGFQNVANANSPGLERKIRITVNGSTITGTTPKSLTIDWYGFWLEAPFADDNGLHTVKLKGESQYDTTVSRDWSITVVNALTSLP